MLAVATVATTAPASAAPAAAAPGAIPAEHVALPASGQWVVDGHGYGHGHGLSQYGARGAARRGLSAAQIVAFYYPGTALVSKASTSVRVVIGDDTGLTTLLTRPGQTLTVGNVTANPATARLVQLRPSGAGLQAFAFTTAWRALGGVQASTVRVSPSTGMVRLLQSGATSTDFRGTITAIRNGSGEMTVNTVSLDDYTRSVVPREMPSSWEPAAVQAQAIAARSYGRYAVEHSSGAYDICDSTNCQVYGGAQRFDSAGNPTYGEVAAANNAVAATSGQVATYGGATIFAQFSASNGGWLAAGSQPYLVAKADPYEAYSDDPYLNWTRTVSVAALASHYGLSRLTSIDITGRDGAGQWGGRVRTAVLNGVRGGSAVSVDVGGESLANAMDLPHTYFAFRAEPGCPPASASLTNGGFESGLAGWRPSAVQFSTYRTNRQPDDGGSLLNGQATASFGSIAQDVTPVDGVGSSQYAASVWALRKPGQGPAAMRLYLWEFDAGGRRLAVASQAVSVPADGAWHQYATKLAPRAGGKTLRVQIYLPQAQRNISLDAARLARNCLVNGGFDNSNGLAGWSHSNVSLARYGARGGGGLLNGQALVDGGSISQDITPTAGVRVGVSYAGLIWVMNKPQASPAHLALYVWNLGGTRSEHAASYLTVPNDGVWHAYSTTLTASVAGKTLRYQLYLWYAGENVTLDIAALF